MTILLNRRLNGRPMAINPGTNTGAQTSHPGYTLAQLAASGIAGAGTTYLILTPPAGAWPSGAIKVIVSGVPAAIGNVTGAVLSGNVLIPSAGATSIKFTASLAQLGRATIATTNTMGLTDPAALSYTVTASNTAPPALSDLIWHQLAPVDQQAADATVVGWLEPVGGIGPFTYSVSGNSGYGLVDGNSGQVRVVYYTPNSQGPTFTATVTDARGITSAPLTVAVQVAQTSPVITLNDRNPANNCTYNPINQPILRLVQNAATISILDRTSGQVSTHWSEQYDYLRWIGSGPIPAATYPLAINFTQPSGPSPAPLLFDLQIVDYTPISFIEFVPGLVSTSMNANSLIGHARATTPNNAPQWSVTDASATFQIDSTSGNVYCAKQPAAAGPITFSIGVTDNTASYTQSITINVVQGVTLAPTNMTLTVPQNLTNDTYNNVIGTPAVTGMTGTKSWSLVSQTGYNVLSVQAGIPARYQINSSNGAITAPTILSADLDGVSPTTDVLVVSCTDGMNTCTQSFSIPVAWAQINKTFHVGRGMSKTYTDGTGFETMTQVRAQCMTAHTGTYHVLVYADADPDYYTNDNGTRTNDYSVRFPWQGPIVIEGVAANGRSMPRVGGPASNTQPGGTDMRGKGFFVSGDGDSVFKNLEISGCHDAYGDGVHGVEAIRKDGAVAGNMTVQHCYLHDNDNNLLSAFGHGALLVEYCLFENGGTSHVSSGACHNAYLGEMTRVVFRNNISRRVNLGHLLKSRAQIAEIYNNRFYDGVSGSASACIEIPFAGQATIYGNVIEKGTMAFGPDAIRYGAEGMPWSVNTLDVHSNTISVLTLAGSHYGTPSAVGFFYGTNAKGVPATISVANNSLCLAAGSQRMNLYGTANTPVFETGTIVLSAPPAIDTTRPDISGTVPPAQFMYRLQGQDDFQNFSGLQQISDSEQIRIAASTASGTVICNVKASNDSGATGAGTANPFGAGTTWTITTAGTYYGNTPWAAAGKYAVVVNSDGSAALKVAGALATGVDYVQLRATAPGGGLTDVRYPVVVS